jgi:hypothetical protein
LPQEGMKIASRPPRGGGSPHWFLGKLCGGQLIDFKLEIGGPFLRTGTWQPFRVPQEGMKTGASEHTIERPQAEKAGTGLVQFKAVCECGRGRVSGDRRMTLLPQGGKPDKE